MTSPSPSELVSRLSALPPVQIDPRGTFKYVLIEATAEDENRVEQTKLLVRGDASCEYHADIYDALEESARRQGLDCQCLGGGRIRHDPEAKHIKVYGYSMGFGRADYTKTVELLKEKYPGYTIEWSNEGY